MAVGLPPTALRCAGPPSDPKGPSLARQGRRGYKERLRFRQMAAPGPFSIPGGGMVEPAARIAKGLRRPWAGIGLMLVLAAGLSACGVDGEQARLCRSLIPAFEGSAPVEILEEAPDPAASHGVLVTYRSGDAERDRWILCRFAGGTLDADRLRLDGVTTDREGELTPIRLRMLQVWLGVFERAPVRTERVSERDRSLAFAGAYFLQQLVNGTVISCIYGLLAIGYTLVYGIIGRINLAFGEMAMVGGFATVIGATLLAALGGVMLPVALLMVLALAMLVGAVHGWATERLVFRPMRGTATQAPLIATIGLAVGLQEYVRLVQSSRDHWLQPIFTGRTDLVSADGFTASIGLGQILILALTAALFAGLTLVLARTGLGRAQRACSDDAGMAAMVGVDVDRTIGWTFLIGAGLAAVAGFIIATYLGGVNFYTGHLIGFKALTAAIVGGIGSVPGALLGGFLIGMLETFWSGYLTIAYKDIAVFGILTLVLIFRPIGLLGRSRVR